MRKLNLFLLGACVAATSLYAQSEDDWKSEVLKVKELIKTNPEQAEEQFDDLLKGKRKKNIDLVLTIGRAYLDAGKFEEAENYAKLARKADSKSAQVSIFEGDIAVARKDPGTACQRYEEAIYFDSNCKEAYFKYADIYRGANPQLAIEKLEQLRAIDASIDVERKLAEFYYSSNKFDQAAATYERFISSAEVTEDDLTKYSFALFLNHDFAKSLEIANMGLQRNPQHSVFNRLRMYDFIDLKRYDEAKSAADAFFAACKPEELTYLDYLYHGYLLSALKSYEEACVSFVGIGIGGRHRDVGGFGGNADGESVLGGHDGSRGDEIMKNVGRNCTFGTNAEYHHGIVALRFEAPYPAGIDRLVAAVDELIVGGGPVDCAVSFFEFDQGLGYGLCSF